MCSSDLAGLLSGADVRELLRFYADPRRHRWHSGPAVGESLSGAILMQHVLQLTETRVAYKDYVGLVFRRWILTALKRLFYAAHARWSKYQDRKEEIWVLGFY